MTTVLLCHGWGLTPAFWDPLLARLPDTCSVISWDLGYGSTPAQRDLPPLTSAPLLGVGHSLGFAQLVLSSLPFTTLIGFNSFARLTSATPGDGGVLTKKLSQMSRMLAHNPPLMLSQFYDQCGGAQGTSPLALPLSEGSLSRLTQDLEWLKTLDCLETLVHQKPSLEIFLNQEDPIVPYAFAKKQFESLSPSVKLHTSLAAHHGICEENWDLLLDLLHLPDKNLEIPL